MQELNLALKADAASSLPIRAIQFGEGNFIRGFLDWMLYQANQQGLFNGRVLALQCTPQGKTVPLLNKQDNLFTCILHKYDNGKVVENISVINTIAQALNPYENWEQVLALSVSKDIRFVFSNTTEAGLTYVKEQAFNTDVCPQSYPGKLTQILYERFKALGDEQEDFYIIPLELVEGNGTKLKELVLSHVHDQQLPEDFRNYVLTKCVFVNTLVDRVVSGYPQEAHKYEDRLNYKDVLMTCGEDFHFLALEGDEKLAFALPLVQAGLNVVITDDISEYCVRKIRILNGTHTAGVASACLASLETVDQMVNSPIYGRFIRSMLFDEIVPVINLETKKTLSYAEDVLNRFADPTSHHLLTSILLNMTSKVKTRLVPSILDARSRGGIPKKLCFALASYLALYKDAIDDGSGLVKAINSKGESFEFKDDAYAISVITRAYSIYKAQRTEATALLTVQSVFADSKLWDSNLASDVDLIAIVARIFHAINSDGVENTVLDLIEHH